MPLEAPKILYDEDADILYISMQPGAHGIVRESLPGVLWRYQPEGGAVVGVTVVDFSCYWAPRLDDLALDVASRLQISAHKARSLLQRAS